MAYFDLTALCFLNRGDEIYEGYKVIDRDAHTTCLYYTEDWKVLSESEPLFVLKLMGLRLFRAAGLLSK